MVAVLAHLPRWQDADALHAPVRCGLIILTERAEAREGSSWWLYLRRSLLLVVFGALHGQILWWGDVLYHYAICGLLAYGARRWRPTLLFLAGVVFLVLDIGMYQAGAFKYSFILGELERVEPAAGAAGVRKSAEQKKYDAYRKAVDQLSPSSTTLEEQIAERRGRGSAIRYNTRGARRLETVEFYQLFFDVMGMMLCGMALAKWGVLTGERSGSFYRRLAVVGFAAGVPVLCWSGITWMQQGFPLVGFFRYAGLTVGFGRLSLGLAYVSLVILMKRRGAAPRVLGLLGKAGQMALTNYVLTSALTLFLFSGFGFQWFARFSRVELVGVVLPIWLILLLFSHWWLLRYRFGPLEWIWRSATYGTWQSMRLQ